jgi:hypothetical protein
LGAFHAHPILKLLVVLVFFKWNLTLHSKPAFPFLLSFFLSRPYNCDVNIHRSSVAWKQRVRFSTSVLFCVSLGLEMLTPVFPHHFLFLATLANVGKSISLAAYLATSSAIHRSFALGDNLADISAKGQAQTVVADNLGLAVAVCINHFCHYHPRLGRILPLAMFPVLALVELVAIRQQLEAVHLQTLNKVNFLLQSSFILRVQQ